MKLRPGPCCNLGWPWKLSLLLDPDRVRRSLVGFAPSLIGKSDLRMNYPILLPHLRNIDNTAVFDAAEEGRWFLWQALGGEVGLVPGPQFWVI